MRQKIQVSNPSARKLLRNLAETNRAQSDSLFTIRCYGDHAELPNRNLRNPLEGWLFCYGILGTHSATTRNYRNCQAPHFIWEHTVHEEQLETKFWRDTENEFTLSLAQLLLCSWRHWCYPSFISVKETVVACSTVEWPLILSLLLSISPWAARQLT